MYYVLRIMRIMHYALGVHIVCYVLRITYYVLCITHWGTWESTSYVMYYVLCIVYDASYIAHFRQAHHVCVLAATFYVLAAGTCTYYENYVYVYVCIEYCSTGLRNLSNV